MTFFPERMSRAQIRWLFGHAIAVALLGFLQTIAAWDCESWPWRVYVEYVGALTRARLAGCGGIVAIVAGLLIAVLCAARLSRPFVEQEMPVAMKFVFLIDGIVLFSTLFLPDVPGRMVAGLIVAINIALVTLFVPAPETGKTADNAG